MLGLCVLGTVLAPGAAHAAVTISFEPASAVPGAMVEGTTLGEAMKGVREGYFDLYLAPSQRIADAVSGRGEPKDARLVPIGRMNADEAGVGKIRFKVPRLEAGTYAVVAHCASCVEGGSTFSSTDGFVIEESAKLPNTGSPFMALMWTGLLLVGAGALAQRLPEKERRF